MSNGKSVTAKVFKSANLQAESAKAFLSGNGQCETDKVFISGNGQSVTAKVLYMATSILYPQGFYIGHLALCDLIGTYIGQRAGCNR